MELRPPKPKADVCTQYVTSFGTRIAAHSITEHEVTHNQDYTERPGWGGAAGGILWLGNEAVVQW